MYENIVIKGARVHNLKNIDLVLPKNKLIVFSGVSGSGKSSLAFDTIFKEGQRRYIESLSSYARQFLGKIEKPEVDLIEGLSPSISIEQKSTHSNSRSIVGTTTEIFDYMRILWAKIGKVYCPICNKEITSLTIDQIIEDIYKEEENSKLMIASVISIRRKGEYKNTFENAKKLGYQRVIVDDKLYLIDEVPHLDKNYKHSIDIVVDRLKLNTDIKSRLISSCEKALEMGSGTLKLVNIDTNKTKLYSTKNSCATCLYSVKKIEPRLFSFNSPYGACTNCNGIGKLDKINVDSLINKDLSINQGAIQIYKNIPVSFLNILEKIAKKENYTLDTPLNKWKQSSIDKLLYGCTLYKGLVNDLDYKMKNWHMYKKIMHFIKGFYTEVPCPICNGQRLCSDALNIKIKNKNIMEVTNLSIEHALEFFSNLELDEKDKIISKIPLQEIINRLNFLNKVGLNYLTLDRESSTLSGGESQRIRLATQIGSALSGVLYVLDEPSIGLHQKDNDKLLDTLFNLRDKGNTVIVVEHDYDTLKKCDHLVDFGPRAGDLGGEIVASGTVKEVEKVKESLTGQYLTGKLKIERNRKEIELKEFMTLKNCTKNNLKNIDVKIPLRAITVITGVSGSGKSSLLNESLLPALQKKESKYYSILENGSVIDKVIEINQKPIGRTPRSNAATYIGLFTLIRDFYASLSTSKARGYKSGRFSFNVKGGRCEACQGDGLIKVSMSFLSDVFVTCDVCHGKRYNSETLSVTYKGKNIYDVLNMTVDKAYEFFSNFPRIKKKLQTLKDVGLGYITLGQNALYLSGGEAQRVKLANELSKVQTGNTCYIIDEPTTGLHAYDVRKLVDVLQTLRDKNNTIVIVEHNLDVIKIADYIIDLGPDGGEYGGEIIASGTVKEVSNNKNSYTAKYLKKVLNE